MHISQSIFALSQQIGVERFIDVCTSLMAGAEREHYVDELRYLTGHAWKPEDNVFDRKAWPDYWVRSWGARGLLHVWDDHATDFVVAGLADEHWRPAEMCLKVVARHEVAGSDEAAASLLSHELPRVRIQALRALAVVGDSQQLALVRLHLDDAYPMVRRQAAMTLRAMSVRLDIG
ncbi:MAG: HEAT repeat domain-containing protein, partial [Fimbriimonas sp.]